MNKFILVLTVFILGACASIPKGSDAVVCDLPDDPPSVGVPFGGPSPGLDTHDTWNMVCRSTSER